VLAGPINIERTAVRGRELTTPGVARQQPRHRYLEVVVLHQRAYNQLPSFNRCLRALSLICELFAVLFGGVVVFAIKQLDEGVLLGKVPASTGRSNTGHDALGKR
jgi:hypothetical protein